MSRNEDILQAIINGESLENYRPQSRNEEILKRIALGESLEDISPQSRMEALLIAVSEKLGSGGSGEESTDMLQQLVDSKGNATQLFYYYQGDNLDFIKNLDLSNCTSAYSMFESNSNITQLPDLNFSDRLVNTANMLKNCTNLKSLSNINTSQVTNASYMFSNMTNLKTIPAYDFRNNKNFNNMFSGCISLEEIPIQFPDNISTSDYSNTYSFRCICFNNSSLTRIPESYPISTSLQAATAYQAFAYCTSLEELPEVKPASNSISGGNSSATMFDGCTNLKRVLFYNMKYSYNFSASTRFEVEDLIRIMAGCAKSYKSPVLTLGSTNLAKLEGVYVKPAEITLSNGNIINGCVQCESTEEGAVTPEEYMTSLGWTLA